MPESFDHDLRAYYKKQHEEEQAYERFVTELDKQFDKIGSPEMFDLYRDGEYYMTYFNMDYVAELCWSMRDSEWEIKAIED